jgi:hypothetical protein
MHFVVEHVGKHDNIFTMASKQQQAQWFKDLPLAERVSRFNDFMVKEGFFLRVDGQITMSMAAKYPSEYYMNRWNEHIAPEKKSKEKPKK